MNIKRRKFIKVGAASTVLLVPGIAVAAISVSRERADSVNDGVSHIQKSIKASFGGGFSVKAHTQSNGLTYADIEHVGARYSVVSADLFDWRIVRSL